METPTVQISRWKVPTPVALAAWLGCGVPVLVWTVESYRNTAGADITVNEPGSVSADRAAVARAPNWAKPIVIAERADEKPLAPTRLGLQIGGKIGNWIKGIF